MKKNWIAKNPNETEENSMVNPTGNTRTVGLNPKGQLYNWFFTLDKKRVSAEELCKILKQYCKWFKFQGEIGKSGYEHWQGHFSLINKEYFSTVKNIMPYSTHLEATRDVKASDIYCQKEDTKVTEVYTEKTEFFDVIEKLSEWQSKALEEILNDKNSRKIFWYWSESGNKGKSDFADYLEAKHEAIILDSAKCSDIAYIIDTDCKLIIFDIAKAKGNRINYEVLEKLKNGRIFSTKYKCIRKRFQKPTICVFANEPPKMGQMSEDRWIVTEIV